MPTYNTFAAGYREILFVSKETTYGTIVHPAATDAIQHQKASFDYSQDRITRADKTSNRSMRERITHRKQVTWNVDLYILPSGTGVTAPDIGHALEFTFGSVRTVANATTHGTTPCTVTSLVLTTGGGAGFAVGDACGVLTAAGVLEVSFVTAVSTDTLTISPALSAIPAVSTAVKGSISYKLADVLGSLTITRILDNHQSVYPGCFVNDAKFDFPAAGEGTMTLSGMGQTEYSSGVSTLASMINNSVTSITVATGEGKRFQANTRALIESECVLITAVSTDTLTVTRAQAGTTAASHASGLAIGPYEPSRTLAGSPVSGTIGSFIIVGASSARTAYKTTQFSFTLNNQGSLRNSQFGTDSASGFFVNKRDVNFSVTLWLEAGQTGLRNDAKNFTMQEIVLQLGNAVGSTCAVRFPRAEFNIPKIEAPDDTEVMVPFDGVSLGSLALGNDEVVLAFL